MMISDSDAIAYHAGRGRTVEWLAQVYGLSCDEVAAIIAAAAPAGDGAGESVAGEKGDAPAA